MCILFCLFFFFPSFVGEKKRFKCVSMFFSKRPFSFFSFFLPIEFSTVNLSTSINISFLIAVQSTISVYGKAYVNFESSPPFSLCGHSLGTG
ncbi:Uncharacterized protein APZ42_027829, partial [Daphnia magna]